MIPQVIPSSSRPLHTVVEEDERRKEEIITSTEDSICVTRDMLKTIVHNVLEDQKKRANAGSKEVIKSAYAEGIKKGYKIEGNPLLSSTMGQEHVMGNDLVNHSTISTPEHTRDVLHSVHSLRPNGIDYITKQPLVASNAMPI